MAFNIEYVYDIFMYYINVTRILSGSSLKNACHSRGKYNGCESMVNF